MPISTSKLFTIDRFIMEQEGLHPAATGEFTNVLHDLMFAIRIIAANVRRAGLNDILGLTEDINVHGEIVRRLDSYANEVINRAMSRSGNICAMVSEESEGIIKMPEKQKKGKYILAFDPLDGSTNIEVTATIGTIFSLYKRKNLTSDSDGTLEDILQPGTRQVAAGYVLYGSSTILVYTTGHGVNVFTYDPMIGEFLLTYENLRIPKYGNYFSCNMAHYKKWSPEVRQYIDYLQTLSSNGEQGYTMRYIATAAADIHRTLHYGGIYMYPGEINKPEGKLRLIYEVNPLSMLVEEAGGKSTSGSERIMDIEPDSIHQTVPLFIGSTENVEELEMFLKRSHSFQNINRIVSN